MIYIGKIKYYAGFGNANEHRVIISANDWYDMMEKVIASYGGDLGGIEIEGISDSDIIYFEKDSTYSDITGENTF